MVYFSKPCVAVVVQIMCTVARAGCQPIRALCFGEDLAAGHGEGRPHTGGPVADKHRVGDLSCNN